MAHPSKMIIAIDKARKKAWQEMRELAHAKPQPLKAKGIPYWTVPMVENKTNG